MFSQVGPGELIIVLVIALLILGPNRLPEVARSLGKGMREFKGAIAGEQEDELDELDPGQSSEKPTSEGSTSSRSPL